MTLLNAIIPTTSSQPSAIPTAALDGLSDRLRICGLTLFTLRQDGTVDYFNAASGAFFDRYILPQLSLLDLRACSIGTRLAGSTNTQPVFVDRTIPGVLLAVVAHSEKRQLPTLLVLAAKDETFGATDEVHDVCSRLGLDAHWLIEHAAYLPAYTSQAMVGQGCMFLGILRDNLRLAALEDELASVSEQLAATYEELSLIYQVSSGMKVNRSATDFFRQTCLDVQLVMGTRGIGVALRYDPNRRDEPTLHGADQFPPNLVSRLGNQLTGAIDERRSPLLINDVAADNQFAWLAEHGKRLLAVPLQRHEQILGCLYALDKEVGDFDSADSKLLTSIANESAIYLENSRLFEDMRGLMMGLLHSLTSAVDAKDAYTCGHSERVALLSRHIAQEIGLDDREVEQIYMAGLLHDVGKIGVPESVLQKAGKLTVEEFDQMKKHPEIGAKILQDVRQLQQIVPGVMHHHERYDGHGYPASLAGEAIPLMGRIICLADCFDAMTTNRTYRRALPLEVAMAEIRRCAGTQFDPALVEAFLHSSAERYRELLSDHQRKSKRLLGMHDAQVAAA